MNINRSFKIIVFVLVLLITAALIILFNHGEQNIDQAKTPDYPKHVGYIDVANTIPLGEFKLCGNGVLIGYYHSSAPKIYRDGKYTFRKYIQSNYQNNSPQESGYLNLRFHINCEGKVGNLEVNELDSDLNRSDMDDEMVKQIINLVIAAENWEPFGEGDYNYYMYLNFKIRNGEIREILP